MRKQFRSLSFIIGALALARLADALPPSSDLTSRDRRTTATRSKPTPMPAATRERVAPENRPSTTIVIDAGHGGHDRGGIAGQRVPEKMMTLDVAQRLRNVLEAYGYRVVMTRNSDVFVSLPARVAIANSYRDAIFVCVHFNAARRGAASGIETYFYSRDSLPLASAVHYYVAGGAPTANRGVRRRGYYVLRRTRIPAVLVECGFLTNPTEAQYAQNTAYRQKLAEEIARGVRGRSWVGSMRVAAAETIPLQPFIDQTRVRDPDLSRSKRSSRKSSKAKSSKRKKSSHTSDSESESASSTKKKSAKKHTQSSDDESSTKKKSTPKKTED
jgi:N-acetylmuramoyl-L-alanine amidase